MKGWYIVVEVAHGEQAFGEEGESSAHGGLLSLLDWDASIVWILSHPKNDSGGIPLPPSHTVVRRCSYCNQEKTPGNVFDQQRHISKKRMEAVMKIRVDSKMQACTILFSFRANNWGVMFRPLI